MAKTRRGAKAHPKTVVRIEGRATWKVSSLPSGHWLGVCDELGLTLEGTSRLDLYGLIDEGMQLLLGRLLATRKLATFAREHGWRVRNLPVRATSNVEISLHRDLIEDAA